MPTYAYRCSVCEHAFEIQQAFTDDSLTECPECQGTLRKLFSTVGVVFKGSGFYRTDSRSGSTQSLPPTPSNGSSSEGSSSASSSSSPSTGSTSSGSSSTSSKAAASA